MTDKIGVVEFIRNVKLTLTQRMAFRLFFCRTTHFKVLEFKGLGELDVTSHSSTRR